MKQLKQKPFYGTYFVNNTVIYAISDSTASTSDIHATVYDTNTAEEKFPKISFKSKDGCDVSYYLDSLITDGDKLTEGAFVKVCHECSPEAEKNPFDYFKFLCENQISETIGNNNRPYSFYYDASAGINRLDILGVPLYMLTQTFDDVVDGGQLKVTDGTTEQIKAKTNVIDFTEEKFNTLLNDEILKRARQAANNAIKKYNKEVDNLTIKNIE